MLRYFGKVFYIIQSTIQSTIFESENRNKIFSIVSRIKMIPKLNSHKIWKLHISKCNFWMCKNWKSMHDEKHS